MENRIFFPFTSPLFRSRMVSAAYFSEKADMQKPGDARLLVARHGANIAKANSENRDRRDRLICGFPQTYTGKTFTSARSTVCRSCLGQNCFGQNCFCRTCFGRTGPGQYRQISYGRACGAGRGPFPWQDANGLRHRPEQPSDNRPAGPTFRGIHPASCCNGSSGGASAT